MDVQNTTLPLHSYAFQVGVNMNTRYYAAMLAAFEKAAYGYGYIFLKGADPFAIPDDKKDLIGKEILAARLLHISPKINQRDLYLDVERYNRDGEGVAWVDGFLQCLADLDLFPAARIGWVPPELPYLPPVEQPALT